RRWLVISNESEEGDAGFTTLTLTEARTKDHSVGIGFYVEEPMESVEFGRIAAQKAKQVIVQKVLEAERAQVVNAFKERIGQLVTGIVKRVTREFILMDLGNNADAILMRTEMIPHEAIRVGDRVRAYLYEVRSDI